MLFLRIFFVEGIKILVLITSGERPTMPELLRLKIPQGVGGNCYTFGIFLLNDQTGGQVDTFKREYQGDAESVVRRILREWLEGKGLPVTWSSLIKALRDTELLAMADQIQDNLLDVMQVVVSV